MSKNTEEDKEIETLANEIQAYLEQFPNSSDNFLGIAKWWITQHRMEVAVKDIERALSYLEQEGVIRKTKSADGTYQYQLKKQ